ncbi:MAG: hypothetical protein Q9166_004415 [cf. Caloplaca sp. 2 TL-2023]
MVEARKYTVRPYKPARADLKDSFKVYLSARALQAHNLGSGGICQLSNATGSSFPAIVEWLSSGTIQDTIIQTTETLRDLYDLKLGDHVSLSRSSKIILNANDVILVECRDPDQTLTDLQPPETLYWAGLLDQRLKQAGILCPRMIFNHVCAKHQERTFRIESINASDDLTLYQSADLREVSIAPKSGGASNDPEHNTLGPVKLEPTVVGGLDAQITRLNELISEYGISADLYKFDSSHRLRRGGVILHGPSGAGKSMLLDMIAEAGWRKVYHIEDATTGAKDAAVRKLFSDAHQNQPSVIVIDNLDATAGKKELLDDSQSFSVASSLCKALDTRGDSRVLIIAATQNLALVEPSLRRPGRFQTEIAIPVPGTNARAEILNLACGLPKTAKYELLPLLVDSTHGYVGADIVELIHRVKSQAAHRIRTPNHDGEHEPNDRQEKRPLIFTEDVIVKDIEAVLLEVQPTAMKEIFLDTPKVKWSDIGGQEEVKKALRKAVEWPLKVCDHSCIVKKTILKAGSIVRKWND